MWTSWRLEIHSTQDLKDRLHLAISLVPKEQAIIVQRNVRIKGPGLNYDGLQIVAPAVKLRLEPSAYWQVAVA